MGDVVYAYSCSGKVVALDEDSGAPRWIRDISALTPRGEIHGQPAVHEKLLIVPVDSRAAGGAVYALDRESGEVRWRSTTPLAEHDGGFTTDILVSGANVITISARGELVALRASDGRIAWSADLGDAPAERRLSATLAHGVLYVTAASELRLLRPDTGKLLRRRSLGAEPATSVVAGRNHIYVGLKDKTLRVLDRDGDDVSTIALPDVAVSLHSPAKDLVAVLTAGDELLGVSHRAMLWRHGKGKEWSSPRFVSTGGNVVAGASSGEIVVLDGKRGEIVRRLQVKGMPRGIALSGSALIVGTLAGNIYRVADE